MDENDAIMDKRLALTFSGKRLNSYWFASLLVNQANVNSKTD